MIKQMIKMIKKRVIGKMLRMKAMRSSGLFQQLRIQVLDHVDSEKMELKERLILNA